MQEPDQDTLVLEPPEKIRIHVKNQTQLRFLHLVPIFLRLVQSPRFERMKLCNPAFSLQVKLRKTGRTTWAPKPQSLISQPGTSRARRVQGLGCVLKCLLQALVQVRQLLLLCLRALSRLLMPKVLRRSQSAYEQLHVASSTADTPTGLRRRMRHTSEKKTSLVDLQVGEYS